MVSFFFNDYKSINWFVVDKNIIKMSMSLVLVSIKILFWFVFLLWYDRSWWFFELVFKKIE